MNINKKNHHHIRNFFHLPDYMSLANAVCGLLAIFLVIKSDLIYSVFLILAAGIFDFLDGRIARRMKLCSEFGKQLDSLCDVISFVFAPAVIGFCLIEDLAIYEVLILIFCGCGYSSPVSFQYYWSRR